MPVVGLTSLVDKWNGNVTFSFNAVGFSVKSEINDNGYERGVSYLSVKMNAQIPSVSEFNDTYWVTRGALLLSDSLENVWEEPFNNGVFMETLYKDVPGAGTKSYYDIVQSDPENPGISGFTAHYLRMSASKQFTPASHSLQYVRFYLGNPQYQGICLYSGIRFYLKTEFSKISRKKFRDFLCSLISFHYLCTVKFKHR